MLAEINTITKGQDICKYYAKKKSLVGTQIQIVTYYYYFDFK